jgi:uncharacterized protein YbjT (DUF2867 family)
MRLDPNYRVTIFGGSGFVGRHLVRALAKTGVKIRVAVRRPNEALFLKTAGRVGQVEIVQANIRDEQSCKRVLANSDAVVNAVGILYETGSQKFVSVQAAGAARIAQLAKKAGVKTFVHISALGADADSSSLYARSKAAGEAAVRQAIPKAIILRPSLVIGPEDDFFNRFAAMAMLAPALPLIGGGMTRYQPVTVFDLADCIVAALSQGPSKAGTYDIGGGQIYSFKDLMSVLLAEIGRHRLLIPIPFFAARIIGAIAQFMPKPLLTLDQVRLLEKDNVVEGEDGLKAFGITPQPIEAVLPPYLGRYRRH